MAKWKRVQGWERRKEDKKGSTSDGIDRNKADSETDSFRKVGQFRGARE